MPGWTTRAAGGILREEGDELVAVCYSVRDGAPPLIAELDLVLVEPDIVPALFQIGLNKSDQLFIIVVAIAEEDAERRDGFLKRNLTMSWADPEIADICQRLAAFWTGVGFGGHRHMESAKRIKSSSRLYATYFRTDGNLFRAALIRFAPSKKRILSQEADIDPPLSPGITTSA